MRKCPQQYEVKLSRFCIEHTRLTDRHLMTRNDQQLACTKCDMWKPETDNETLPPGMPQWRDSKKV